MRTGHPRLRAGHSLAEMLVAIAIVSVVASAAATTLHLVFRADAQLRDDLATSQALHRLANQFRADLHGAQGAPVFSGEEDGLETQRLQITHPEDRVTEFESNAAGVTRIRRRGEQVEHRELYRLAPRLRARFLAPESDASAFATMLVEQRPPADDTAPWSPWMRVEASVGFDGLRSRGNP